MTPTVRAVSAVRRGFSLPAVLILTALMAGHILFFNSPFSHSLAQSGPAWMAAGAAGLYDLAALAVFFLLVRTGNIARYRRIFFVSTALLFFPSFIANILEVRGHMALTTEDIFLNQTPFCHIVLPIIAIPAALTRTLIFPAALTEGYASFFSMLTLWLAATVILGRGWCSWVCFYGGWDDGFSRLRRKAALRISPANDRLRYAGFAMLLFIVLASLPTMTVVYCEWFCPFKLITEFEEPSSLRAMLAFILMVLLFFSLAVVLPLLTRKRVQCTSFCPFGAFQSLAGRVSPFRITLDADRCVGCYRCVEACPTLSLKKEGIDAGRRRPLVTCTLCGECVNACPAGALEYGLAFHGPLPLSAARSGTRSETRPVTRPATRTRSFLSGLFRELLHPRALFLYAGYAFGFVIASGFASGTLFRLFHWAVRGQFLLPGGGAG